MTTKELRTGAKLTLDEFLALGETDERMELDHGALYIMGTANKDHQFIVRRLCRHVDDYADTFLDPPVEIHHEITTVLSRELQVALEPDVVIIRTNRSDIGGVVYVEGVPDIVVEIMSNDRTRDLVRKRQIYAESGVLEYWIFDPVADAVAQLELTGVQYTERASLSADDILTTPLLPGLEIPLTDIFRHRRRPPREG
jgi:Uma2 family endonuclease